MALRAEAAGLNVLGLVTQRDALLALGFERWNEGQLRRQTEALGRGRGRDAIGAWDGRGRASILVDPGGLGRLRWLLLSTSDLPVPDWLRRALARHPASD